jgi:tRNA (Thr-GGU) A37 N-methylase
VLLSAAVVYEVRKDDPVSSRVLRLARTAGHPSEIRIEVDALEAIDGTPVVDVKPAIDPPASR